MSWELLIAIAGTIGALIWAALHFRGKSARDSERKKQAEGEADASKKQSKAYKRARGGAVDRARRILMRNKDRSE